MKFSAELLALLDASNSDAAQATLLKYFGPEPASAFTGARFERLGGGGDRSETAHQIVADDLVAITTLSVDVPGAAAIQILETRCTEISDLLGKIPTTLDLVDAGPDDIGPESAAWRLFDLLRETSGLGRTKVTKLLARKRPRLIPIYDTVIAATLEVKHTAHWKPLAAALRADDKLLHNQLIALRDAAGIGSDISPLRTLDVLAWMSGKGYAMTTSGSATERSPR